MPNLCIFVPSYKHLQYMFSLKCWFTYLINIYESKGLDFVYDQFWYFYDFYHQLIFYVSSQNNFSLQHGASKKLGLT